jgi:hypothetical protein
MDWEKKWVLLVDVMGVSAAVRDTARRDELAEAYVASVTHAVERGCHSRSPKMQRCATYCGSPG